MAEKSGIKIAAQNRKAHHDYFVRIAMRRALSFSARRSNLSGQAL